VKKRGRFTEIGGRVPRSRFTRLQQVEIPERHRFSPELQERKANYHSTRWRTLRRRMLDTRECRKCFFCGAWATTLEHLVGHGGDAVEVGLLLGLGEVDPDWRVRFWTGPFGGACELHATQRAGAETAGRLLQWTRRWMEGRDPVAGVADGDGA